ncbi:hypothetical protein MHB42_00065 [Lysinibacillus sp. FSL K6-0232]
MITFEHKAERFRLKGVFQQVDIPEATYHYHMKQLQLDNPNQA